MNTPEQQAALYRKAADTIEMCGKHGVVPKVKLNKVIWNIEPLDFTSDVENYEFPLAVLEGKLVWKGDELWATFGNYSFIVEDTLISFEYCSWNPPKPKTVMVELMVEDAELLQSNYDNSSGTYGRVGVACRKALVKAK